MTNSIGQILLYESLGLSHLLEARKVHIVGEPTESEGIRGEPGTGKGGKKGKFPPYYQYSRGLRKGSYRDRDYEISSSNQLRREFAKLMRSNPKVDPKGWKIRQMRAFKKANPSLYPPEEKK